ncbi:polysaccharide lyase [Candidatus Saccharibacteria bacterium]|nr:polysaccharide lyase [Candidatus Saccharibacteria bacterium]
MSTKQRPVVRLRQSLTSPTAALAFIATSIILLGLGGLGYHLISKAAGMAAQHEAELASLTPGANLLEGLLDASGSKAVGFGANDAPLPAGDFKGPAELFTKPVLFVGDFNTGDTSQYADDIQDCPDQGNVVSVDRTIVRSADSIASGHFHVSGEADCYSEPARRAEAVNHIEGAVHEGDERWYQWSTLIGESLTIPYETSRPYPWFIFMQWHHKGLDGSPPLDIDIYPDGVIHLAGDGVDRSHHAVLDTVKPGVWRDYVLHVKFSKDESIGFVEAWVDGVKTIEKYNRPTMIDEENYFKLGAYTDPTIPGEHDVWHDGLIIRGP